jgi:uncharacterized RDD family membrane protein YckC
MRCPKCHYLSFDPEPRCKNCGYGLSLEESDLFIREDDLQPSPFADLDIQPTVTPSPRADMAAAVERPAPPAIVSEPRAQSPFAALHDASATDSVFPPAPVLPPPPPAPRRPAPTTELPLFVRGTSNAELARADEPLVRLPAETRPPLSVRRKVADPPAPKPRAVTPPVERTPGPLDRDLLADLQRLEERSRKAAGPGRTSEEDDAPFRAGPVKRLAAAVLDGVILGSISVAVMWITLRWCGLPLDRALMLPVLVPTSAFLSLVGVGYLVLFTAAGGQTLGKMAAGIRVISDAPSVAECGPLGLGQAVLRAVLTLPSVLVAGLGFLPALAGDERAVHDRLAHTRVVRA